MKNINATLTMLLFYWGECLAVISIPALPFAVFFAAIGQLDPFIVGGNIAVLWVSVIFMAVAKEIENNWM